MPRGPQARPTRPRSFIADALAIGGATGLGQLLLLASAPLLSRLYSPEEVGRYGLFLTALMLATTAANLKFELAIPSVRSDREALSIGVAALLLPFPVALVAGVACAGAWAFGVPGFAAGDAWVWLLIVPALVVNGVFTALRYWHVRRGAFSLIGRAMIAQSAGRAAVPVAAGLAGLGWSGLVIGELAGRAMGVGSTLRQARADALELGGVPGAAEVRAAVARNAHYPRLALPSSMVDALAAALPLPLFFAFFGANAGGQLALVQRMLAVPAALVASSFGDVLHSRAGNAATDGGSLMGIMGPAQRRLMVVAALVYLPVVLLAPSLFAPVFGNAWLDAGLYAAVLAPMVAAWTVASPLTRIFLVRNRLRVKLAFDVLNMVVPIGALAALRPLGPLASLAAYSAGGCLVAAGVVVVARRLSAGAVAA